MGRSQQVRIADVFLERFSHDVDRFESAGATLRDEGAGGVHQLRVACRRLRGDLRLFRDFVKPERGEHLRTDLRALANELGPARDLAVHRHRLADLVADGSPPEALRPDLRHIDQLLAARERRALARACAVIDDGTYQALRTSLRRAVRTPPLTESAQDRAAKVLPELVYEVWRPMDRRMSRLDGDVDNEAWHQARIRAKQTRYAAECAEHILGKPANRLAVAAKFLQDLLGAHQDAVVAARTAADLAADRRVRPSTAEAARWLADREEAVVADRRGDLMPVRSAQQNARSAAKALKKR
jgi:CHAD domain-containing protein